MARVEFAPPEDLPYRFDAEQHIHTLDGRPLIGTSTALSVIAKPLTWWAAGMAVGELGWTNSKDTDKAERVRVAGDALATISNLSPEDYLARLDRAYRAHNSVKNKTATAGKDLHASLEAFVKARISGRPDHVLPEKCGPFVRWCAENVEKFLASEVHVYSRELWVGGIFDVLWKGKDGKIYLGDFKSSKDAYASQFVQCAGYCLQLAEHGGFTAAGKKYGSPVMPDAIAVIPFGADDPTPRVRGDVAEHIEAFRAAVTLYKLTQKYEDK